MVGHLVLHGLTFEILGIGNGKLRTGRARKRPQLPETSPPVNQSLQR